MLDAMRWLRAILAMVVVAGLCAPTTVLAFKKKLPSRAIPDELGGVRSPVIHPVSMAWSGGVMLTLGAVATTVGVWAGVMAVSHVNDAKPYCGELIYDDVCGPVGIALRKEARTYAAVSTVGVISGLTALLYASIFMPHAGTDWHAITEPPRASLSMRPRPLVGGGLLVVERPF